MCVLRAYGDNFEPDTYLSENGLASYSIFSKGDKRFKTGDKTHETSGFKADVSTAAWTDREEQFRDALEYLRRNSAELNRLVNWDGVEEVSLDFPFEATGLATFIRCPIELAKASSELGIMLEFSIYPEANDETE